MKLIASVGEFRANVQNAFPSARVYHNTTQVVATANPLSFNSERWDRWGMHSTSSNTSRLTCKVAGLYTIGGCVQADLDTMGFTSFTSRIFLNGTTRIAVGIRAPAPANVVPASSVSCIYPLAAGDYVELNMTYIRISGGNATFKASDSTTGQNNAEFWAAWIGGS